MDGLMGKTRTTQWVVEKNHTAQVVQSGGMEVLASPTLLAWMENTAYQMAQDYMEEGYTTVGTKAELRHVAATPVGMTVTVTAKVLVVDGRKITFDIEAKDEVEQIGTCTHQRFVVQEDKFLEKCRTKHL
jgi:predicted thioesterase